MVKRLFAYSTAKNGGKGFVREDKIKAWGFSWVLLHTTKPVFLSNEKQKTIIIILHYTCVVLEIFITSASVNTWEMAIRYIVHSISKRR